MMIKLKDKIKCDIDDSGTSLVKISAKVSNIKFTFN